jgi:TolA-binding protein
MRAGVTLVLGIGAVGMLVGCGGGRSSPGVPVPAESDQAFQEMVGAMDNTLLEVNQLERRGGGIRDRIVLIDARSTVNEENQLRYIQALDRNFARIQTLRNSLQTNEAVRDVLTRNGHIIAEVVAINSKSEGAVVVYYDTRTAH